MFPVSECCTVLRYRFNGLMTTWLEVPELSILTISEYRSERPKSASSRQRVPTQSTLERLWVAWLGAHRVLTLSTASYTSPPRSTSRA